MCQIIAFYQNNTKHGSIFFAENPTMKTLDKGKTNNQQQHMEPPKCLQKSFQLKTLKSSPYTKYKGRKGNYLVVYLEKLPCRRKQRLKSLLRVLNKFKQFGIPNGKFTMMQLNQKIEDIEKALSRNERRISCQCYHTFKIPKTPYVRKGYTIPKIRKQYHRLNKN